jgi:ubiquinone/menaquinone biosynthesis C-methylase UbiE
MAAHERRFDPRKRALLLDPARWAKWDPPRLLAVLHLQPGETVVDLGCGPGFWTLPLAELVGPDGIVWALDASPEMLEALADRQPPPWVRLLRSELPRIELPDASVDAAWGAFIVHEVEPLDALMRELHRVLRPGGRVGLLDWRPDAAHEEGPPRDHRLPPEIVRQALEAAGFHILPTDWQHEDAYLIRALRPLQA